MTRSTRLSGLMDVYLVPIGPDGYELYCEPQQATAREDDAVPAWRRKAAATFRAGLAYLDGERERRAARRAARYRGTVLQRIRDRVIAWLAERVAEQRLLWHLRQAHDARAQHPDDLTSAAAAAIVMHALRRDGGRHARWLAVNAVGFLIAAPLSFIPGPNVILYYFIFRGMGHYLSWIGARHGLTAVTWQYTACPPLTDLRRLTSIPLAERAAFAQGVALRVGLEHLDTFAERMALVSA